MTIGEYNSCVDSYSDGIYRFVLKNLGDSDASSDIVQDTYMKLWIRRKDVDVNKTKSYLYTTAYHTMIDYIRKNKRTINMEDKHEKEIESFNQYTDLKEILNEAVEKLPDIQKSVILLRDYEGYSYQEIGEITKLTESQVKVYIYRARVFLKKFIVSPEYVI